MKQNNKKLSALLRVSIIFLVFELCFCMFVWIAGNINMELRFLWFTIPFHLFIYISILMIVDSIETIRNNKKSKVKIILAITKGGLSILYTIAFLMIRVYSLISSLVPDFLYEFHGKSIIVLFIAAFIWLIEFIIYITSKIKDKRNLNN